MAREQQAGPSQSDEEVARRLALLEETTGVCIWERDLVTGRAYWSDCTYQLYDWPSDRQPPSHDQWLALLHPDDRAAAKAQRNDPETMRRGYDNELRIVRPDGQVRWILNRAKADFDEAGQPLRHYGVNIDITERKQQEQALRESEERFRLIADSAPVPMWVTSLDRKRWFVNRAYVDFLGVTYDEAIAFDWRDVIHPDDLPRILAEQAAKEASLQPFDLEARYRTADGGWCWLRSSSQPRWGPDGAHNGFIGVAFDITVAKEAELQLQRLVAARTAELEGLYNRTPTILQSLNAEGRLVSVSDRWLEFMGYAGRDEVIGRPVADFTTPECLEHFRAVDWPTLLAGGDVVDAEYKAVKKSGEIADVLISSRPSQDAAGNLYRTVGVLIDVTGKKRTEEALRQSQKVEAMGQLTGGVAHDFNNLLSPIIGGLDLLQRRGVGDARDQRTIGGALQAAERAKMLVQRLLAFARRQPLQSAAVDATRLVEGMADLIAATVGPRIRVQVEIAPDLPSCLADPNQVEMALLNLSVNARDAMPEGGTLTIGAASETVASDPDLRPGRYVRLSVTDTGCGMDPATLVRAIEPFFSTKGIGQGTGLGLSMAHGLAAQLGGALRLRSAPGEGTDVALWLPCTETAAVHQQAAARPAPEAAGRGVVVLVDDDALVRASTADMLGDMGFDVMAFEAAERALDHVREAADIALVVTDHLMPGMTGTELAARLREARPDLPVLLISGYAETAGIAPELPCLTKPFRHADLSAMIATLTR